MTSGISMRSAAICLSRAFRSARSGDPGAYDLFGSLTGCGTRRIPPNAATVEVCDESVFDDVWVGVGMVDVGVDMDGSLKGGSKSHCTHDWSEGLRPSDSPTRSLASRFVGSLRSRGSLRGARSHLPPRRPALPQHQSERHWSEGLRPSDSPTRSLTSRFVGSLRSRGSLRGARSHL